MRHADILGQPHWHSGGPQGGGVAGSVVAQRVMLAHLDQRRRQTAVVVGEQGRHPRIAGIGVAEVVLAVPAIPDMALMGLAISTVGSCRRILDLVVAHVKQRVQFGVPIGSFQAVKHKAADMYVAIERARALEHRSPISELCYPS